MINENDVKTKVPFSETTPTIGDVVVYSDGCEDTIVDINEFGIFCRGDSNSLADIKYILKSIR